MYIMYVNKHQKNLKRNIFKWIKEEDPDSKFLQLYPGKMHWKAGKDRSWERDYMYERAILTVSIHEDITGHTWRQRKKYSH
jgi:hypothetical protein